VSARSEIARVRPAVLELRNVIAGYGSVPVLRDVSLRIAAGTVLALTGSNGAGKTTLLRVASGLHPLISGDVLLDGRSVSRLRPFERSRSGVCLIPEGRGVFPSLTVRENLVLQIPPDSRDQDLERVMEVFPILKDRMKQTAGTMSGGEERMLALARGFLASPKVVLLDEFSTGLAPRVLETVFAALGLLAKQGVGLLIAEQYAVRAGALVDEVYTLSQGRIRLSGRDPIGAS
jgi:branched-chain amino acid transport system ATP-binding protein